MATSLDRFSNNPYTTVHPLDDGDRAAVAIMRAPLAALKGRLLTGPQTRGQFDHFIEHHIAPADNVTYEDGVVGGVKGVWCRPKTGNVARTDTVVLFLHGGGYVIGSAHAFRYFGSQYAARLNLPVFIADYRLAPEHPFPAAIDDAVAVVRELSSLYTQIAIVGESAGAGIALSLLGATSASALYNKHIRVTALMSPLADFTITGESVESRADADPMLIRDNLVTLRNLYLNGADAHDPRASPVYADFSALPPTQIHVGHDELLLDDSVRVAQRTADTKAPVDLHVWEGMSHVFPSEFNKLKASAEATNMMVKFIQRHIQ